MILIILGSTGTTLVLSHVASVTYDAVDRVWLVEYEYAREFEPRRLRAADVLKIEMYAA